MPERPPTKVTIAANLAPRFSANELRLLKAQTGKTMDELLGAQADDADRWQTMAWLQLHRDGHRLDWTACGDVEVELLEEPPDPTSAGSSPTSPASAGSGA